MICSDPIGEGLIIAEKVSDNGEWYIYESYQIAGILIDYIISSKDHKEDYVVVCDDHERMIEEYCKT